MSSTTTRGSESEDIKKEEGRGEIKKVVNTVDIRSSAGHDAEPPKTEDVQVTHTYRPDDDNSEPGRIGVGLAVAAASVEEKFLSTKEAVLGGGAKNTTTTK